MVPYHGSGSNCLKATEPLRGGSLLFYHKFPEITGTHSESSVKDTKNLVWRIYLRHDFDRLLMCYVTVIVQGCNFSRIFSHLILPGFKGYLYYKLLFAIK